MYHQIYINLCNSRKALKSQYKKGSNLHKHHILPVHSGGLNTDENYTYLTIREHTLAHFLLWKIHKKPNDLRSMHMLGVNLNFKKRQIIGYWCRDNKIGFFSASNDERSRWRKRGAESQIKSGIAIFDKSKRKEYASLGGKAGSRSQIKSGIAIFDKSKRKEYASLGGKSLRGMICVTNGKHRTRINPKELQKYLLNGYKRGFKLSS